MKRTYCIYLLNVNKFENHFCTIEAHNFTLIHALNSRTMWIQILNTKIRYNKDFKNNKNDANDTSKLLNDILKWNLFV